MYNAIVFYSLIVLKAANKYHVRILLIQSEFLLPVISLATSPVERIVPVRFFHVQVENCFHPWFL